MKKKKIKATLGGGKKKPKLPSSSIGDCVKWDSAELVHLLKRAKQKLIARYEYPNAISHKLPGRQAA